jgi:hypothetical protein
MPSTEKLLQFAQHCDVVRPIGLDDPALAQKPEDLARFEEVLRANPVPKWFRSQEHYVRAIQRFEARPKFKSTTGSLQASRRARFLIDTVCAFADWKGGDEASLPRMTTDDRRKAIQTAEELLHLLQRGVRFASRYRTTMLFCGLYDLAKELGDPISQKRVRTGGTFAARWLAAELAERFLDSFGDPLTESIHHLLMIAVPSGLADQALAKVVSEVRERRRRSSGTLWPVGTR